jgi:hypothetical protein
MSGVGQHVSTYMNDRIGEHVETDISSSVEQHMGSQTITDDHVGRAKGNQAAKAIREMLSDKEGVRRAVLVNEILKRRTFSR